MLVHLMIAAPDRIEIRPDQVLCAPAAGQSEDEPDRRGGPGKKALVRSTYAA